MATPQAAAKARGRTFETDLVEYLRDKTGHPVERLRLTGPKDEGDLYVQWVERWYDVIEAKAPGPGKPINLSGWMKEAEVEAVNFATRRNLTDVEPILVIKAINKPIADAYVVRRLRHLYG